MSALVTGASRGIGSAIALELASRGVKVALHFHSNSALAEAVLATLPGYGHGVFSADLSQSTGAVTLWNKVSASLGKIDILVNNAGVFVDHPPLKSSLEQWQQTWRHTLTTNLESPAHLSLLAGQAMMDREIADSKFGRGRIINISSRGAFRGEPDAPAYGASKAGMNALSQSLAKALAPNGIYVYCLAPGWVGTDMAISHLQGPNGADILAQHPLGRIATATEIATAACYCALDAPTAMTGSIIDVNGASYLRT